MSAVVAFRGNPSNFSMAPTYSRGASTQPTRPRSAGCSKSPQSVMETPPCLPIEGAILRSANQCILSPCLCPVPALLQ